MPEERSQSNLFTGLVIAAFVLGAASLIWCIVLESHAKDQEKQLATVTAENAELKSRLAATDARLRATGETLSRSLGVTQQQLETRAQALLARQAADTQRLEAAQNVTQAKVGEVSSEVTAVKTDVGGVKTDVANTRTDLESTKGQLQRVMGDAGVMSGLIAKNHDELEVLKHKGDKNYYEFTLHKGDKQMVGSVRIQLKKVDNKHGRYTMTINADDRDIEKKDKSLLEPMQFYSGKTPVLNEIVVNAMDKNTISGYLATPKN